MCCSFNVDDPDELFTGDLYPGLIKDLDASDRANAFTSSDLPKNYDDDGEPKVQPGQNKG